jgi:aryl-alcohol dehydrogenase-like predicted oxidoreductase
VGLLDTANVYGDGAAERIVGRALKGRRDQVQIATKVGLLRRGGRPEGLSAAVLRTALAESLERLATEWVDVYYLHAPDPAVPLSETLQALHALLDEGKIRAWGVSNHASWQILELNQACDARQMPRPVLSQVLYNLLVRQLDVEYFAFARRHPIQTTVYNPLAGGLLAREARPGDPIPSGSRFEKNKLYRGRYWSAALLELAGRYQALAREAGLELVTLAYAWLARTPGVDSILAGPATVPHLDAALDASSVILSPDLCARVDQLHRDFLGTDARYGR